MLTGETSSTDGGAPETVATLLKIVGNILSTPAEAKFRKLKRSNKRLKRTVLADTRAVALLEALGFVPMGREQQQQQQEQPTPSVGEGKSSSVGESEEDGLELPTGGDLTLLGLTQQLLLD